MCFRQPEPDPEPIALPQVITYYLPAPTAASGSAEPAESTYDPIPPGDGWLLVPSGGGGVVTTAEPPQSPPAPAAVRAPEIDAGSGLGACLLLCGALAVMRGGRR